nr:hypothetical protein [Cupriavidus sp. DB3]
MRIATLRSSSSCALQRLLGGTVLRGRAAALQHVEDQQQQKAQREGADHRAVARQRADRLHVRQHDQPPVGIGNAAALREEFVAVRHLHHADVGSEAALFAKADRLQRIDGRVLPRRGELPARLAGQLAQRLEAPVGLRAQEHDAVGVDHQDAVVVGEPGLVDLVEIDLDRGHAEQRALAHDRLREVVARLAADGADAIEAARLALHRVAEIRPVREVDADEAGRLVPVAGGQRQAVGVHHVDGGRFGGGVDLGQEAVGRHRQARCIGFAQQALHVVIQRDHRGQIFVAAHLAAQSADIGLDAVRGAIALRADADALAPQIGDRDTGRHHRADRGDRGRAACPSARPCRRRHRLCGGRRRSGSRGGVGHIVRENRHRRRCQWRGANSAAPTTGH